MTLNDHEIVALYHARDEQAIEFSQKQYGRYCHTVSMHILHSQSDAEECVNDTWLRAWNTIPPQRPGVLRTYLAHIIRNLAISRYRRDHAAKRSHAPDTPIHELSECLPDPDGSPANAASSSELREALNSFVAGLDELDRKLFVGRYWHSYTPAQLAKAYGIKENALNQRLFRIRERLRKHLSERGYHV